MLKRIGVFALMLSAAGAVFTPATAFAQDRTYYARDARDRDRHERREWRERERREHDRCIGRQYYR